MTLSNLATVFGPNFLRRRQEASDGAVILRETVAINEITQMLIENENLLLPRPEAGKRTVRKVTASLVSKKSWSSATKSNLNSQQVLLRSMIVSVPPGSTTLNTANSNQSSSTTANLTTLGKPKEFALTSGAIPKQLPRSLPKKRPIPVLSGTPMSSTVQYSNLPDKLEEKLTIEELSMRVIQLEKELNLEKQARRELSEHVANLLIRLEFIEDKL